MVWRTRPQYKCVRSGCDAAYVQKHKLKERYLNAHSDENPFVFSWLGYEAVFNDKWRLQQHPFVHEGEKRFVCDWKQCGKRFYNNRKLKTRYLTHINESKVLSAFVPNLTKVLGLKISFINTSNKSNANQVIVNKVLIQKVFCYLISRLIIRKKLSLKLI